MPEKIELNLDTNRIKTVLWETYQVCKDHLGTDFNISQEKFVLQIVPYLASNRVSIPVLINLPSLKYPELRIEVNLRRKKVFARMINKRRQAEINGYLNAL